MEENNINIEEIMADIKREIKEKGLTGDMLSFEDVPYKKTPQAGGSVKEALDVLNKDGALGIFPEGTRNKTKEFLQPFKFGAVSMAKKTDSYIVPVGVTGTYKFRSHNLIIRIGKPFKVTDNSCRVSL